MNIRAAHSLILVLLPLLVACSPQVPEHFRQLDSLPAIYPDYADVTIPVNIAPLNFEIFAEANDAVTRFSAEGEEIVCGGLFARPAIDEWKSLLAKASGKDVSVEVFCQTGSEWIRFKPFSLHVSPDSIDPWMCYRLISPSYVSYEELTLNQRCLENFDEQVIVDNMLCSSEYGGQCVNCHSFQQWNPERWQFHARQAHSGTFIAYDGKVEKVNIQHPSLLSPGVYPSWHPTMKLIAYSTNKTLQSFHTAHPNKIEVIDSESSLILYDVEKHEVSPIECAPDEMETYPCWASDGKSLYYCGAHFKYSADTVDVEELVMRAEEIKYNIYRKTFNPTTRQFGNRELVFPLSPKGESEGATSHLSPLTSQFSPGLSATLPRLSPDGQWLLFTLGQWGCFHIWHRDADLWLMRLSTGEARPLEECNSDNAESYHSWSSNGRWIVFSSRRNDGVFTRPFFAHISADGHGSKPFELPQHDPDLHRQLLKSYNVPELMRDPVSLSPQSIARELKMPLAP